MRLAVEVVRATNRYPRGRPRDEPLPAEVVNAMKPYPPIPSISEVPDLLEGGHLWLQEYVDGAPLRVRLESSGAIVAGDADRPFERDAVPVHYRRAVTHVRNELDRDALRRAVPDVSSVVFFGVATCRRRMDYDWERLPPYLGHDVWSATDDSFLPPDTVEKIFERLGLAPAPAIAKELRAVDFDPEGYDFPASRWADGPVAGVIVRNKRGGRAKVVHPDLDREPERFPPDATAESLVDERATEPRLDRLATELEREGWPVTPETLFDRALSALARELGPAAFEDGPIDEAAFRDAVAARTSRYLAARD
ncbi:hypothetical protein [Halovivax sp.]|uniref:hypothetical protein n=1 Tax=Halovivax sp. TaxID=1935978 RepID=UPI0025C5E8DA|nr:hypothetical protein [Halovivax sp.]